MDYTESIEAIKEALWDVEEGADMVMKETWNCLFRCS
jgi:delta-aminolevulinic acid dehydratase/porphobilinogen synthase